MANTSPEYFLFENIKNVFKNVVNTDSKLIFKDVVMYRDEQVNDVTKDRPHSYPYMSVQFTNTNFERINDYDVDTQIYMTLRLHTQELHYDKFEMLELCYTTEKLIFGKKYDISDTDKVQLNVLQRNNFVVQTEEVICSLDVVTSSFKQNFDIDMIEIDVDYLVRVSNNELDNIIPKNQDSYYDISGTRGVVQF